MGRISTDMVLVYIYDGVLVYKIRYKFGLSEAIFLDFIVYYLKVTILRNNAFKESRVILLTKFTSKM